MRPEVTCSHVFAVKLLGEPLIQRCQNKRAVALSTACENRHPYSLILLVARGLPRDTENIPVYWKNFTSGLSFTVSILGQH